MTNQEMLEIAMRQSAEDMGGCREDFMAEENVVFPLKLGKQYRGSLHTGDHGDRFCVHREVRVLSLL